MDLGPERGRVTGCKAQWPTVPQGYKEALAEAPEEDHRSRDLGMKVPGLQAQSVRAWPARDPSPGLQPARDFRPGCHQFSGREGTPPVLPCKALLLPISRAQKGKVSGNDRETTL